MGAANSVCKLTVDTVALLEQLEPNDVEIANKKQVEIRIQSILQEYWPTCHIMPFGSSESGFAFGGSDLDLGIYFDDWESDAPSVSNQQKCYMLSTAQALLSKEFEIVEFIDRARVPVIKLWHHKLQVACDLTLGNRYVQLNTALLKVYGRIDPRVRPLIFAVKYWAKQRRIIDAANGMLNSYAFSMLVLFYLQSNASQVGLPSTHSIFKGVSLEKSIHVLKDHLQSFTANDVSLSTYGAPAGLSTGALLAGFFQFYASEFNFRDQVVSIRTAQPLQKTIKWRHNIRWRLSIEDPLEINHDLGRVVFHPQGQRILENEFNRAQEMMEQGCRLHDLCAADDSAWYVNASCYICNGIHHTARNCRDFSETCKTSTPVPVISNKDGTPLAHKKLEKQHKLIQVEQNHDNMTAVSEMKNIQPYRPDCTNATNRAKAVNRKSRRVLVVNKSQIQTKKKWSGDCRKGQKAALSCKDIRNKTSKMYIITEVGA